MTTAADRLAALGIDLPVPPKPAANYVPAIAAGGYLYIAGQIPIGPAGPEFLGKLGADVDIAAGQAAARLCAINILAQVRAHLGDLDRAHPVKLVGFVNCTPDFTEIPKVVNGASDLMVAVYGDLGRHARSAVGVASLPFGVAVEVEAVFAIL